MPELLVNMLQKSQGILSLSFSAFRLRKMVGMPLSTSRFFLSENVMSRVV